MTVAVVAAGTVLAIDVVVLGIGGGGVGKEAEADTAGGTWIEALAGAVALAVALAVVVTAAIGAGVMPAAKSRAALPDPLDFIVTSITIYRDGKGNERR